MIRKIGVCSIGFEGARWKEEFEFEDGTSEEVMEEELWDWAHGYLEAWFEEEE